MIQPWFNLKIFLIEDTDTNREEKKRVVWLYNNYCWGIIPNPTHTKTKSNEMNFAVTQSSLN
jgi:hypothetical protein